MEIIFAPNGQYSSVTATLIVMFEKIKRMRISLHGINYFYDICGVDEIDYTLALCL